MPSLAKEIRDAIMSNNVIDSNVIGMIGSTHPHEWCVWRDNDGKSLLYYAVTSNRMDVAYYMLGQYQNLLSPANLDPYTQGCLPGFLYSHININLSINDSILRIFNELQSVISTIAYVPDGPDTIGSDGTCAAKIHNAIINNPNPNDVIGMIVSTHLHEWCVVRDNYGNSLLYYAVTNNRMDVAYYMLGQYQNLLSPANLDPYTQGCLPGFLYSHININPSIDYILRIFQAPQFVINTIAYVPDVPNAMDSDSSDEDIDDKFRNECRKIKALPPEMKSDKYIFPFTTQRVSINKKGEIELGCVDDDKIKNTPASRALSRIVESLEENGFDQSESYLASSRIVEPFLRKLKENGFDQSESCFLPSSVKVSIGLNRPLSLSSRKNQVLVNEFNASAEINHTDHTKVTAFFWQYNWYDLSSGKKVDYEHVLKFYKQLKSFDKENYTIDEDNRTNYATQFRMLNENGVDNPHSTAVPYQALREYVKNHQATKDLVAQFSQQRDIYFSIIDIDTRNFNGIYSAYYRIYRQHVHKHITPPTVMSTGYEFRSSDREDLPYVVGSKIDKAIREETAKYVASGVYYPEPNMCVLLPRGCNTLPESFVNKEIPEGNLESPILLRQVLGRNGEVFFVFSGDNPIITEIPGRVKWNSGGKSVRDFSDVFKNSGIPTEKDLKALCFSQSTLDAYMWATDLQINGAFSLKAGLGRGSYGKYFRGPVTKLCNGNKDDLNLLMQIVGQDAYNIIVHVAEAVYQLKEKFRQSGIVVYRDNESDSDSRILKEAIMTRANSAEKLVENNPNTQIDDLTHLLGAMRRISGESGDISHDHDW